MTFRVGILGAGIGEQHLDGYLANTDRFQVSKICDLDEDRATGLAKQARAEVTTDIADVLADTDIDIVDICLPPF